MGTGMITILASAIIVNPCMLYGDEFAEPMAREMANYKVRVTYDPNLNRDCLDAYTLESTSTDADATNGFVRVPSVSGSVRTRVGVFGSYDAAARAVFSYIDAPCGLVCHAVCRWDSGGDDMVLLVTHWLVGVGGRPPMIIGRGRETMGAG